MRIGILGGTFDPVHRGHVEIAHAVRAALRLDGVLFMIAGTPPHKRRRDLTGSYHRHAMAVLATLEEPGLACSSWELEHGGFSYTVDTMRFLRVSHPENEYCFIAGSDSLKEITLWREYDTLLRENCFVFIQRSGEEVDLRSEELPAVLRDSVRRILPENHPTIQSGRAFLVEARPVPASSTLIRRFLLRKEEPPEGWLCPSVLHYIRKYRLYEHNQESAEGSLPGH